MHDLLIASQDQQEGENLLKKLMEIWKMKITGRINCQKKGALQFLGRSIYRAQDGESSLYFGVSREYMVGIFESWGENIKTGHVGLPKLEDVHKEFVKKFWGRTSHREGNSEVSSCFGSVGMGRFIQSRSFFSHLFSFEVSGKAQSCCRTLYACLHEMAIRKSAFCSKNASTSVSSHRRIQGNCFIL